MTEFNLKTIFFFVFIFVLSRQVPLASSGYLLSVSGTLLISVNLFNIRHLPRVSVRIYYLILISVLLVTLLAFYSLLIGNDPLSIFRSYSILLLIPLAFLFQPRKQYVDIFLFLFLGQALVVIGFEAFLLLNFSPESYLPFREFVKLNNWGDIYTFGFPFWRIQLRGSALLPVAFMLAHNYLSNAKRAIFLAIFTLAIICASNFAFILCIFLYLTFAYRKSLISSISSLRFSFLMLLASVTLLFASPLIVQYTSDQIAQKSTWSNAIRIDQAHVLWDSIVGAKSFVGTGLGFTDFPSTPLRSYTGTHYFELQPLYFLSQLGIFGFFAYSTLHFSIAYFTYGRSTSLLIYLLYLFYASFNPYILDWSQIAVILTLHSAHHLPSSPLRKR